MFDKNEIALEAVAAVQKRFAEIGCQLFFGGIESICMDDEALIIAPLEDSPLRRRVELLVEVANGTSHHEGEVREALLSIATTIDTIPAGLQTVIQHVQLWLNRDELITLTETAQILRGSAEDRDLVSINGYIQRGKLTVYTDPNESNPQHARRVSRSEVTRLKETLCEK